MHIDLVSMSSRSNLVSRDLVVTSRHIDFVLRGSTRLGLLGLRRLREYMIDVNALRLRSLASSHVQEILRWRRSRLLSSGFHGRLGLLVIGCQTVLVVILSLLMDRNLSLDLGRIVIEKEHIMSVDSSTCGSLWRSDLSRRTVRRGSRLEPIGIVGSVG